MPHGKKHHKAEESSFSKAVDSAVDFIGSSANAAGSMMRSAFQGTGGAVGGATRGATHSLKDAGDAIGEDFGRVRRFTAEVIESTGDAFKGAGHKVRGRSSG